MENQADFKSNIEIALIAMRDDKNYDGLAKIAEEYSLDHIPQISLQPIYFENLKTAADIAAIARYDGAILWGAAGEKILKQMRAIAQVIRPADIPLLAFAQGMQAVVLEIAENIANIQNAGSDQYDQNCSDIFYSAHLTEKMKGQIKSNIPADADDMKRFGQYPMLIQKNTKLAEIFKVQEINLLHDHQTELNLIWQGPLLDVGLIFSGTSPDGVYIEAVELKEHPFYIALSAEPFAENDNFQIKPLYNAFFKAAAERSKTV